MYFIPASHSPFISFGQLQVHSDHVLPGHYPLEHELNRRQSKESSEIQHLKSKVITSCKGTQKKEENSIAFPEVFCFFNPNIHVSMHFGFIENDSLTFFPS